MTMDNVDSNDNVDSDEDDVCSPKLPRSPTPYVNEESYVGVGGWDKFGSGVGVEVGIEFIESQSNSAGGGYIE